MEYKNGIKQHIRGGRIIVCLLLLIYISLNMITTPDNIQ